MPPRTRKPASVRREEIARAVLRIVGERGYPALTTATLAEEVGVTTGALFRHFASLEEILRETAAHAIARIEETFPDPSLPPMTRILELAKNRMRVLGPDPGLSWLLRSDQAPLVLPADAVETLRAVVARSRKFVLDAVREGVSDGSIRSDIEPEILVVPILGTIHALIGMSGVHRYATGGRTNVPDRVLDALATLLAPSETSKPKTRSTRR